MGLLDRFRPPRHDEESIRTLLVGHGATEGEAAAIVNALAERLTPDRMHDWLAHPKRSHPVPDPESVEQFGQNGLVGIDMDWTPVNAVAAGKAHLVLAEAQRFATDHWSS